MIERSVLKSAAREQIKNNIGVYFLFNLVAYLILFAVSFTGIGALLISGPLFVGNAMLALEITRTRNGEFGTGFKGFNYFGTSFLAYLVIGICTFLWTCLLIIPGIIKTFSYAMTPYIIADNPEISALDAIDRSKKMMDGHKWELFVLKFTFIGWTLLGLITCGLAFIYVQPYMQVSIANFYENLKIENTAQN